MARATRKTLRQGEASGPDDGADADTSPPISPLRGEPDNSPPISPLRGEGNSDAAAAEALAPELLRTGQVLERARITHQILYRYITLGLIEPAETTGSGLRLFHPDVVRLIEIVKSLNQSGYSLRDVKDIFFKDARVRKLAARPPDRV